MVHVQPVGDFVGNDEAKALGWRHDQPPAVADRARARAASPAAHRIADADRTHGKPGGAGNGCRFGTEKVEGFPAQPALHRPGEGFGRAADQQLACFQAYSAAPADGADSNILSAQGDGRPIAEGDRRRSPGQLGLHPGPLLARPAQGCSRRPAPGHGQSQLAPLVVDPQAQPPSRVVTHDRNRQRQSFDVKDRGRQGEIPARLRPLR